MGCRSTRAETLSVQRARKTGHRRHAGNSFGQFGEFVFVRPVCEQSHARASAVLSVNRPSDPDRLMGAPERRITPHLGSERAA